MACDASFVTLSDMILPGRGLLGNRSHAWLDTVASFGLEYERSCQEPISAKSVEENRFRFLARFRFLFGDAGNLIWREE